jgi:hypothetical protein
MLLAACGSSGDDEGGDAGGDDGVDSTAASSSSPKSSDSKPGESKSGLREIKDGNYEHGKVELQVSGDKEASFGGDGTGFAQDGFALLTYGSRDAAVIISFSAKAGEGALSLTTNDYAGSWEWDKDCKLNARQTESKFEGDFSCDKVEAVSPTSAKTYKLSIKGTFTGEP